MSSSLQTSSTVREPERSWDRVVSWFLIRGDRFTVAAGLVAGVVIVFVTLTLAGVLAVGPDSSVATLLGSGVTAGVVTLVTIALSINQLILSRVFGSPDQLADRLEGSLDLRRTVEELAGVHSSPNDPSSFLSLVAATLADRTTDLQASIEASAWRPGDEVTAALRDVANYGSAIEERLEDGAAMVDVLDVVIGPAYALNMSAVDQIRAENAGSLSSDVRAEFDAVDELLESLAVTRQFFKTLSLQQDFAHLSRLLVYSGFVALVVTLSLTLVYRTNTVTLPTSTLPTVVGVGFGVILAPFAFFAAFILRGATIAHRTVSVGPFVPPSER